jgi:hypothetical protein
LSVDVAASATDRLLVLLFLAAPAARASRIVVPHSPSWSSFLFCWSFIDFFPLLTSNK